LVGRKSQFPAVAVASIAAVHESAFGQSGHPKTLNQCPFRGNNGILS
jgi:hypothetical protein